MVEPGNMDVLVGSNSDDIHLNGAFEIIGETRELLGRRSSLSRAIVAYR